MHQKYIFEYNLAKETVTFNIAYNDSDDVHLSFHLGEPLADPDMRKRPGYTPHAFLYKVCACGAHHTEAIIVGHEMMELSLPEVEALIIVLIEQVTNNKFVFIEKRSDIDEMIKGYKK